jgi:hypothetical protein
MTQKIRHGYNCVICVESCVIFTVDLGLIVFDDLPEMTGREGDYFVVLLLTFSQAIRSSTE